MGSGNGTHLLEGDEQVEDDELDGVGHRRLAVDPVLRLRIAFRIEQ